MKREYIICIIASMALLILSLKLFEKKELESGMIVPNYQDSLNNVVNNYNVKKAELEKVEDSLSHQIKLVSVKLSKEKAKYKQLKDSTLGLIQRAPKECDSLASIATELIKANDKKDSLFEAKSASQDSLIAAKEQGKVNCEVSFVLLQHTTQACINTNIVLQADNNTLNKKLSRNKVAVKALTVAVVVVTALFTLK